jgi:titin
MFRKVKLFFHSNNKRWTPLLCVWLCASLGRGAVFTVTTTADSGAGSLRQAILDADTNSGPNNIIFQIKISGPPFTITPLTVLPSLGNPTIIDGTTQNGFTNAPVIELSGASAGENAAGLQLLSGFSAVRGLAINRFSGSLGYGIVLNGPSNVIQGNYIGTDMTGTLARGNGRFGIYVNSSGNLIGGTNAGNGNLISGGNGTGIYIFSASGNTIQGNLIGATVTGTNALGNVTDGVEIFGGSGNLIGGTNSGARNVISGNGQSGVYLFGIGATGNRVQGNYIGVDISGNIAVSNADDGITINGAPGNMIGSAASGGGNVISGNGFSGVSINNGGASNNIVLGNFIGTDAAGKTALGNQNAGVVVAAAAGNQIGGTNSGAGNVISGNTQDGIFLTNGAMGNWVGGNFIGLSAAGTNAIPNGFNGISLSGAVSNTIGGVVTSAGNVISGNAKNGVGILLLSDGGNVVLGNDIGTDVTGHKAVANTLAGVRIQGCSNVIGGVVPGSGNVISGNGQQGVWLVGINGNVTGNVIQGNLIGLDATGISSLPNGNAGVGISSAAGNQIGGTVPGARNVISGNTTNGVFLVGAGTAGNVIQANYIGTDKTGSVARGNSLDGIVLQNVSSNQIGGSASGAGNLISGNNANANTSGNNGINFINASWNIIQGNRIGTDAGGTVSLGNSWNAIYMQNANSNQIGGVVAGAGNLLSANGREGIYLTNASWNVIQGNFIGTKADGTSALGNALHGIDLDVGSTNNIIGGTAAGAGNHIAFAQTPLYSGVRVRNGSFNNLISGNSIFSNAALGIAVGYYGVTTNVDCESGVPAGAANAGQNFPVLSDAYSGGGTRIRGTLDSGSGKTYLLQFFASPAGDASGYGEGQVFLGETNFTLGATCSSNFTVFLPASAPTNWVITATATSVANNTSEFSAWVPVVSVSVPPLQLTFPSANQNQISLSWTNNGGSFVLQQTYNLSPPVQWTMAGSASSLTNGFFVATIPTTNSSAFYRLTAQ